VRREVGEEGEVRREVGEEGEVRREVGEEGEVRREVGEGGGRRGRKEGMGGEGKGMWLVLTLYGKAFVPLALQPI
jgi:hypothetical protein